ncbi:MAG: hypothetical protein L0Y71_11730 [Gemmataceae bacterium]|nr:hypothetical protein [Gemmataceae bacterium]
MTMKAILLPLVMLASAVCSHAQTPGSVVDVLKSQGRPSDFEARRQLFRKLYPGEKYIGNEAQNRRMLGILQFGQATVVKSEPSNGIITPRRAESHAPRFSRGFFPNGCGGSGGFNVPDFDFRECCDQHDLLYTLGGNRLDKLSADQKLRACIERRGHRLMGDVYYWGVRSFGDRYYHWEIDGQDRRRQRAEKGWGYDPLFDD